MLVVVTDHQVFSPQTVCAGCLMASQQGQPRWHNEHLCCGHLVTNCNKHQASTYECQMGFRLVNIDG